MQCRWKWFSDLSVDELYEILKLRSDVFVVEQNCVYSDLDDLDRNGMHIWIEADGKVSTYARLLQPATRFPKASIGRVVTHPEFRNRGLSRKLMFESIRVITEEWGEKEIKISAQKYLRKFYESLGFKVVTNEYLEDGIPHYGMLRKS